MSGGPVVKDDLDPLTTESFLRLTLVRLWEGLPQLLLGSAIFSLSWMVALTLFIFNWLVLAILVGTALIGPAWTALLALEANILDHKEAHPGVMWAAFRRTARRSAGLSLLAAFPLLAALFTLPSLAAPEVHPTVWLGLAADGLGLLLLLTLYLYAFPLVVLYDTGLRAALEQSLALASRHLMNTLGLLSLGGLLVGAILYLSSGLLFILPAVWGMFIVNNCRLVISLEEETTYDD